MLIHRLDHIFIHLYRIFLAQALYPLCLQRVLIICRHLSTHIPEIAGLLHDCAREFENDELPAQAKARGIAIGEVERAMPLLLHAYIGAQMIKEIYGVDDAEISQAIYRHTVGARDMTKLDKIIYFADMIEPNRNYPGVDKLRTLAETADLDEILLTAFSDTIAFVIQKKSLIHPDTVAARNFLLLNR